MIKEGITRTWNSDRFLNNDFTGDGSPLITEVPVIKAKKKKTHTKIKKQNPCSSKDVEDQ